MALDQQTKLSQNKSTMPFDQSLGRLFQIFQDFENNMKVDKTPIITRRLHDRQEAQLHQEASPLNTKEEQHTYSMNRHENEDRQKRQFHTREPQIPEKKKKRDTKRKWSQVKKKEKEKSVVFLVKM